jgi:hypothetical protein
MPVPEQRQEDGDHEATQESHPVEARMPPGQIEFGGPVLSVAGAMQIEWIDRVEEALRKLRPQVEAALIDNAEAELKVVRADPASSQGLNRLKISIRKIVERLAINAADAGLHEAIHDLFSSLFT